MTLFSWVDQEQKLTSAALTVRAQALAANDQGKLHHPALFPRVDSRSVKLADITVPDFRPTADRRGWNARGRQITIKTPDLREIEINPVEGYFVLDEREMQTLLEGTIGNQEVFRQIVGPSIPKRTDSLVRANLNRLELDAMRAWALGTITIRNPQGASADQVLDLQFATDRYVTPTPWTGGTGGTAYSGFVTQIAAAMDKMGAVAGAVMRLSTAQAIMQSAPAVGAVGQVSPLSKKAVEDRIVDMFGGTFNVVILEDSLDEYTDGGTAYTRTKVWAANRVAFLPVGGIIGSTYYAPVGRAFEIAGVAPDAKIDVNGMSVYRQVGNGGRSLQVECQVNALSLPSESALFVVDAGI